MRSTGAACRWTAPGSKWARGRALALAFWHPASPDSSAPTFPSRSLLHAPDLAPRVRADASALPFADYHFNAILVINMLLFPSGIDRLPRSDGVLVWVNTLGDQTPIHLPPADVLGALPGQWSGITARAGTGFWLTARRRF